MSIPSCLSMVKLSVCTRTEIREMIKPSILPSFALNLQTAQFVVCAKQSFLQARQTVVVEVSAVNHR